MDEYTKVHERDVWFPGILLALSFSAAYYQYWGLDWLWVSLCILFGILTIKNLFLHTWQSYTEGYSQWKAARTTTAASRYNETLRNLSSPEIQRIASAFLTIQLDMSPDFQYQKPVIYIRGTKIPIWFFLEFMSQSDNVHLAAARRFMGENRDYKRELATELTEYLVAHGLAQEFKGGNRPATWRTGLSRMHILHAFGFTEDYLGHYRLGETIFNFTVAEIKRTNLNEQPLLEEEITEDEFAE